MLTNPKSIGTKSPVGPVSSSARSRLAPERTLGATPSAWNAPIAPHDDESARSPTPASRIATPPAPSNNQLPLSLPRSRIISRTSAAPYASPDASPVEIRTRIGFQGRSFDSSGLLQRL